MLVALAGPTVTGKTTITKYLINNQGFIHLPPYTTRPRRPNETQGMDYFFISKLAFQDLIKTNSLIFWDQLFDHQYGISVELDRYIAIYSRVVITIPIWRLSDLFRRYQRIVGIHLLSPSSEEVNQRLTERGVMSSKEIVERVIKAEHQSSTYVPGAHRLQPLSLDHVIAEILDIIADN